MTHVPRVAHSIIFAPDRNREVTSGFEPQVMTRRTGNCPRDENFSDARRRSDLRASDARAAVHSKGLKQETSICKYGGFETID